MAENAGPVGWRPATWGRIGGMSRIDRDKWDRRYAEDSYRKNNPVDLVADWLPRIAMGKALDLACGAGRNAIFLAQAGYDVDAVDISPVGLERARQNAAEAGVEVNWIEHDLDETYAFDTDYDLILVMWFVDLGLIGRLCNCLAPGGYLLSQQHLVSDEPVIGPQGSDFRVAPGALREAAGGLEILLYEEAVETVEDDERLASARLVARRPR